jgi:hypothetical protein
LSADQGSQVTEEKENTVAPTEGTVSDNESEIVGVMSGTIEDSTSSINQEEIGDSIGVDQNESSDNTPRIVETPIQTNPPAGVLQRFSLLKVTVVGLSCSLLIGSILLNISHLMTGGTADPTSNNKSDWVVILGLLTVTSISLVVTFWHYYIRSIYIKDGPALVPEKWGSLIGELIEFSRVQHFQSEKSLAKVQQFSANQSKKSDDLLESFLTLQEALSARDEEISRLKKGHDAKVFKRFLNRFLRVDRSLREMKEEFSSQADQKNYKYLSRIMQDALEECGVEQFIPEVGSDYRNAGPQIADDPSILVTDDPSQDFKISAIETAGYILEGEGGVEVIVPSKVSIFRFNPKNLANEKERGTDG